MRQFLRIYLTDFQKFSQYGRHLIVD